MISSRYTICLAIILKVSILFSNSTLDKTSLDKRRKHLCEKLDIPYNDEAEINLLEFILDWKGTPYCYGGSSKKCTDCSGFTLNMYREVYHTPIPRVSRDVYRNSLPLAKYSLYQGDFVFFATGKDKTISHLGIYLWDGYFAHASSSKGVVVSHLRTPYYKNHYVSGGAWIDWPNNAGD